MRHATHSQFPARHSTVTVSRTVHPKAAPTVLCRSFRRRHDPYPERDADGEAMAVVVSKHVIGVVDLESICSLKAVVC